MNKIPTLETEWLSLRGWREEDLDAYAALLADEEVTRFIGGVQSRADAWRGIAALRGHWELRGYGLWAVYRKSDDAFVGRVGLQYPEGWPGLEVAWTLARPYWGHGYATEAAKASLAFGFERTVVPRLISLIHPENDRSRRLAQRLGQVKTERVTLTVFGNTFDADIWEISRERWEANQGNA